MNPGLWVALPPEWELHGEPDQARIDVFLDIVRTAAPTAANAVADAPLVALRYEVRSVGVVLDGRLGAGPYALTLWLRRDSGWLARARITPAAEHGRDFIWTSRFVAATQPFAIEAPENVVTAPRS
ncbi:MAG: hypothetical protein KC636_09190 [Myxococcales bacterium]|nr:hypothetical protein [Myxococcales bacterium]